MKDKRITRINKIRSELFDMANSYAGDETGDIAVKLHRVCNALNDCIRMITTGTTHSDRINTIMNWFTDKPELLNLLAKMEREDCGLK